MCKIGTDEKTERIIIMAESESFRDGKRERGPYKRNRRGERTHKQRKEEDTIESQENTPVIIAFREYQAELDCKHDKYERLVKISRDITIESKRIIFLLHRIEGDSEQIIEEAENRLKSVQDNFISKIAHELKGEDVHQFVRSFSPGLQEYIEAVSFYLFIKEDRLLSLDELSPRLTFPEKQEQSTTKPTDEKRGEEDNAEPSNSETSSKQEAESKESLGQTTPKDTKETMESIALINLKLPPLEFMLGLADFTGELMRLCINTIGSGDLDKPFHLVTFMRKVNEGFQLLGNLAGREMVRKSTVMRQSLKKMENACYVIRVRGSEIPKHMLKDAITGPQFSVGNRDGDDYEQETRT